MTSADPVALAQGAEASIHAMQHGDSDLIVKRRIPKAYRHADLDARLRDERTRDEASLLLAARAAGVRCPVVYDIDRSGATLTMERIDGQSLKARLESADDEAAVAWLRELGTRLAALHAAGIVHGDLTTSNVIVEPHGGLALIDFGLGAYGIEDEQRAVDLHLIEEALEATDARAERLMEAVLAGYDAAPFAADVVRRLEQVRERGRNRAAI